ncbi:M36 family metallopeptidase [Nocardioides sp. LS1]|uniref:M36 family metallopeptidase n=1 Tax=Nocardioides sp. LS1 TaxID=1027620 RepID=UPI000FFAFC1D|nr:M36 family metallopeptidase [Nocardioides sp. LS1]GCD89455.1 hypothetical protein NLS1_14610 [Nocardioides sp. LS1]
MIHAKKTWVASAAVATTALAVTMLGLPSQAAIQQPTSRLASSSVRHDAARTPGYLDARRLGNKAIVRAERQRLSGLSKADRAWQRSLGSQALLDFDPLTGTVRNVGRLDGFLTGRSTAPARSIALAYVRQHASALGLDAADLQTLRFRKDYVDDMGLHHLSWQQYAAGRPVFGNGLKVQVTRDGRVLAVQGSPVHGLQALAAAAGTGSLDAAAARSTAARNVGGTTAAAGDQASPVWFLTRSGLRAGWSTYVHAGGGAYQHVVDATSGAVLFRRSTTDSADGDSYVYDNYPGAAKGGKPKVVNFVGRGWLKKSATTLAGNSVVAWADINDNNQRDNNEKTPVPGTSSGAQFSLVHFGSTASKFCSSHYVCTWNPKKKDSWRTNMNADVAQAFYLASNFHDYLTKAPISFTSAAGNFETSDHDPVKLNALDGADTGNGFPDGNHIDNANMDTPPDGQSPTMQMYLFHFPGASDNQEPFLPTSSAFEADVLYHEYTHGLSNRLVVDAGGVSTLNDIQPGSMGEAWSDYYAMDYLVKKGFQPDTSKSGELLVGKYVSVGQPLIRTMDVDCAVGSTAKGCTRIDGSRGGYTYGDFATVIPGAEVHASGEIWGQTLWDLRKKLGPAVADRLITRAMSISADDPSFLDMRNAIVQADNVAYSGSHNAAIWNVFAHRGMGFFAGAINGADDDPAEDFNTPPTGPADQTISGVVTDPTTGDPVAGALVAVAGQGDAATDTTAADGSYSIGGLYAGTYQKVVAFGPGYFPQAKAVDSTSSAPTNFLITRDFASTSGGAEIVDFNGGDYTAYGCGPGGLIDLSLGTGWGSTAGNDQGDPTGTFVPKFAVVDMHTNVNITSFGVDPNATCGDDPTAATKGYRIETSVDGVTWTTAAQGTFTSADNGTLNSIAPTAGTTGVRYVKFWILSNQTPSFGSSCPSGPYSGCSFADVSEMAVFGTEAP